MHCRCRDRSARTGLGLLEHWPCAVAIQPGPRSMSDGRPLANTAPAARHPVVGLTVAHAGREVGRTLQLTHGRGRDV
jgi:hypothetical protein